MGQKASRIKTKAGRLLTRKKAKYGTKNPKKTLQRKKTEIISHGRATITGIDPNNPDKVNQDRIIYRMEYVEVPRIHAGEEGPGCREIVKLVGVCDGHGKHGHEVAQFVADELPTLLFETMKKEFRRGLNTVEAVLEDSIRNICKSVDRKYLYTCHLGDSRAVLARDQDGNLAASPLSIDHIPERDRQRIESFGGLVSTKLIEGKETKPMLVGHLSNSEGGHFSIETSRAIGDRVARKFGLSHKPDITKKRLQGEDMFIILASDGVFSKLNNIQAVQVVFNGLRRNKSMDDIAKGLCRKAQKLWQETEDRTDDISCVIALLQEELNTHSFFQMNKFESFMSAMPMLEPTQNMPASPSLPSRSNWSVREFRTFKETVEMEPCLSRTQTAVFDDGYEFSVNMAHFGSTENFDDWFTENRIASTRVAAVSVDSFTTRIPLGSISRYGSESSDDSGAAPIPKRILHSLTPTGRRLSPISSEDEILSRSFFSPNHSESQLPPITPVMPGADANHFADYNSRESLDLQLNSSKNSEPDSLNPNVYTDGDRSNMSVNLLPTKRGRSPGEVSPSASPDLDLAAVDIDSEVFEDK